MAQYYFDMDGVLAVYDRAGYLPAHRGKRLVQNQHPMHRTLSRTRKRKRLHADASEPFVPHQNHRTIHAGITCLFRF